jgi:hypothetical protein
MVRRGLGQQAPVGWLMRARLWCPKAVNLDLGKLWDDGLDVDRLEPLVPRSPHQVEPDLPGDKDRGVTRRQAGRSLDQHRDVEVVAVEKGAEGIELPLVHHNVDGAAQPLAAREGVPLLR